MKTPAMVPMGALILLILMLLTTQTRQHDVVNQTAPTTNHSSPTREIIQNTKFLLTLLSPRTLALQSLNLFILLLFPPSKRLPDGGIAYHDHNNGGVAQNTSSPQAIVAQCERFMLRNRLTGTMADGEGYGYGYSFNQPSGVKYSPSQWLWDSGAHQISWVALGHVDKAIEDFRSQLHFVLDDGRIPEQINWRVKNTTRLDRMKTRLLYSKLEYNDLTQIPVLPYSLRAIYNATGDVGLLQEFLPGIVRYFHWWRATRDLDGTGVVTILHPWESGLDLTPAYDAALGLPPESRARPSWRDLYPSLVKLILLYKHWYGWDQGAILASKPPFTHRLAAFKVQDVAVNSVYAAGWGILGDLASVYDADLAKECYEQQRDSEHGILTTLWDENEQHFVTGYKSSDDDSQKYHSVRTIQTLFPLLLSSIPASRVDRIVQMLTNESEFWLPASVPSVSKAEKEYNPIWDTDLLWRGPTWGFPNWFIMEGLQKQGRLDVLDALMDKWIWTVKTAGVWEMYNPETGVGYGAEGLGMSTLIVDWMRRLGRI